MHKSLWMISALAASAVGLVLLTWLGRSDEQPAAAPTPIQIDGELPPAFDPTRRVETLDPRADLAQEVEGYRVEHVNDKGQLIQILGKHLTPLPDGRADVEKPVFRVHLVENRRVLEVSADHGTFVAPDNQPRSGTLDGDVRLRLLDAGDDARVNLKTDSPHVQMLLHLESAQFDVEMGQVQSEDQVVLNGRGVRFEGKGLNLIYNELRNRVDQLVVKQGGRLVLDQNWHEQNSTPSKESATEKSSVNNTAAAAPKKHVQFYRARFAPAVRVQSSQFDLAGDALELVFDMDTGDQKKRLVESEPTNADDHAAATTAAKPAAPQPTDTTAQVRVPEETTKAALSDPIIVTWTGRLTLVPEDQPPAELSQSGDRLLVVTGRPLQLNTAEGDSILAHEMVYRQPSQRVVLKGTPEVPLRVSTQTMGQLHGQQVMIDQATLKGYVIGPGEMRSLGSQTLLDRVDGKSATRSASEAPRGLVVRWQKRLDLTFHKQSPDDKRRSFLSGVGGIESANFAGGVTIEHPQFDLEAKQLALGMSADRRQQSIEYVKAEGDVHVVTQGDQKHEPMDVSSQTLDMDLVRLPSGRTMPTRLRATGNVDAKQPTRQMQAQYLDVTMQPVADADDDSPRLKVRTLRARGNVRVADQKEQLLITAAWLEGDTDADQLDVIGTDDEPARVTRADGTLVGPHIVMGSTSQTVLVKGPGSLTMRETLETADTVKTPDDAPDGQLHVTWKKTMRFDNAHGFAHFLGNVVAIATNPQDESNLQCEDLRLEFAQRFGADKRPATEDTTSGDKSLAKQLDAGKQSIRQATARNNVIFVARSWDAPNREKLESRVRLAGSQMTFDGIMEQLQILGAGTMLVENYKASHKPKVPSPTSSPDKMHFAGRGVTLFKWQDQMQMDARHNDMIMIGNVQMLHRNPEDNRTTQLDCRRFVADLEAGAGLGAWVTKKMQPELIGAYADDNVRVISGKNTVLSDHLQYTSIDQSLLLLANEGRFVQVHKEGEHAPFQAGKVRWNLATDDIRIEKVGPVRVPLKRK